jgi:hypothetical protein
MLCVEELRSISRRAAETGEGRTSIDDRELFFSEEEGERIIIRRLMRARFGKEYLRLRRFMGRNQYRPRRCIPMRVAMGSANRST